MALSLFVASMLCENITDIFESRFFSDFTSAIKMLGIMMLGGVIAFFMSMSEYMLISVSSVVTFSVAGIVKVCVCVGQNVF